MARIIGFLLIAFALGVADEERAVQEPDEPILALPSSADGDAATPSRLGASLDLDLGPAVVHEDGTLGRLANWREMTAGERASTLKLLQKRNAQRREALKAKNNEL